MSFLGLGGTSGTGGSAPTTSDAVVAGADPVSAIANAVGALFGTFTQISSQTQSAQQDRDKLLLSSQPKRPVKSNTELWVFIGMLVLLLLVILFKIFV